MAEPFLAEIRLVSFAFVPRGWALCNGQTLPINQNQALFALLGTTFGGNGQTTFALPNLQGRVPIHRLCLKSGRKHLRHGFVDSFIVIVHINHPIYSLIITAHSRYL